MRKKGGFRTAGLVARQTALVVPGTVHVDAVGYEVAVGLVARDAVLAGGVGVKPVQEAPEAPGGEARVVRLRVVDVGEIDVEAAGSTRGVGEIGVTVRVVHLAEYLGKPGAGGLAQGVEPYGGPAVVPARIPGLASLQLALLGALSPADLATEIAGNLGLPGKAAVLEDRRS